jgi:hypothetical protein
MEANKMGWRKMLKNINLLNIILCTLGLIFAFFFVWPQAEDQVSFSLPPLKKKAPEKSPPEPPKVQAPAPMDFVVIADENLFHPERRIPPEKKEEAALPKPDFVLYGTLITPDLRMAYLEDKKAPVTTPGRGKRQTALKVGESLSGFTLKEVTASRVVLSRGEDNMVVMLDDPRVQKSRDVGPVVGASPPHTVPGAVQPPHTVGQPVPRPVTARPGVVPPGTPPMPGLPPNPSGGVQISPGAVNPSQATPTIPSRRQRYMPSNQ